ASVNRGEGGGTRPQERIKDYITDEGEHPNETVGNLLREWCGMIAEAGPAHIVPYRLEPLEVFRFADAALLLHRRGGAPIAALAGESRLAKHKDHLDVVLDDPVWQVGLAQESRATRCFHPNIGVLEPDNWSQVVETKSARADLNVRVQWHDEVPTTLT